MNIFTAMAILTIFPLGALLISVLFIWLNRNLRSRLVYLTGAVWLLYAAYEYLMYARILCTGECNIRTDLLIIYPILLFLSVIAVTKLLRYRFR